VNSPDCREAGFVDRNGRSDSSSPPARSAGSPLPGARISRWSMSLRFCWKGTGRRTGKPGKN